MEEKGIILVADDQYMNLEALKINLQEINKIKKSEFYVNGQEVIDRVKEVLTQPNKLARPIQALLLDFQMPVKNGIQTVQAIKRMYESIKNEEGRNLLEPNYIFLSAHIANLSFQNHCKTIGVEYFFEKPVSPDKLNLML